MIAMTAELLLPVFDFTEHFVERHDQFPDLIVGTRVRANRIGPGR